MPVFDRLVGALVGDEVRYKRRGLYCDECLPVSPCMGHWKIDDEEWITQEEYAVRTEAMGVRLTRGLATLDWRRVLDAAHVYAHIRGGWREEINGGDIFLAMTEPTTLTDSETHVEKMKREWPHLLETGETD